MIAEKFYTKNNQMKNSWQYKSYSEEKKWFKNTILLNYLYSKYCISEKQINYNYLR